MNRSEIENGVSMSDEYIQQRERLRDVITSIDLLEIFSQPELNVRWQEGLNHDGLLHHFKVKRSLTHVISLLTHVHPIS
jgi:hypothetical protein